MRVLPCLLLVAASVAAGCGPTCQSTCRRYYEAEQCDAPPQGVDRGVVIDECISECEAAVQVTGPAPDPRDGRYNPALNTPPTKPVVSNELEAAAWMDCVWSFPDLETCRVELGKQACARVP